MRRDKWLTASKEQRDTVIRIEDKVVNLGEKMDSGFQVGIIPLCSIFLADHRLIHFL